MATKLYSRINDSILLCSSEEEEDGFVATTSGPERRVVVRVFRDLDCVFSILPLTQHVAQEQFAASKAPTKEAFEALHQEYEKNAALAAQLAGRPLVYGQIIQFVHKRTGRFLASRDVLAGSDSLASASDALRLTTPAIRLPPGKKGAKAADIAWLRLEKLGSKRCWFKIMPQKGEKPDGARVAADDKILLLNIVQQRYLRQSRTLDESGHYQVDMQPETHNASLWKFIHAEQGGARKRAGLRHGDAIRVFHENAGYLQGTGDFSLVKCKSYHGGRNETISSYRSIWVVESATAPAASTESEGQVQLGSATDITWGKPMRLRLFGTTQYLVTRPLSAAQHTSSASSLLFRVHSGSGHTNAGGNDTEDNALQLSLTSTKTDQNAVFAFFTPKEKEELSYGSVAFLHTVTKDSKDWISVGSDSLGYNPDSKGFTDSEVLCTSEFSPTSSFSIKMVPRFQLDDFEFCEKRRLPLQAYSQLPMHTADSIRQILTHLADLIKYCTISDNDKPLEREGQPIPAHQKTLATPEFLDAIVAIAKRGPKQPIDVSQLAFRLLKQICKQNHKNSLLVFTKLPLEDVVPSVSKDPGYYQQVPIAEMYKEIFGDHSELLYATTPEQIGVVFQLLAKCRDHHYVELLSAMCRYKGLVIHRNQKNICKQLAQVPDLVFKMTTDKGVLKVRVGDQDLEFNQFTVNHKDRGEVKLFYAILALYSDLCEDRNSFCIQVLVNKLSVQFVECFTALKKNDVDAHFRAIFCQILRHVFTEVHPLSPDTTAFRKVWYRTSKDGEEGATNAAYKLLDSNVAFREEDMKFASPYNIQEFLIDYLFDKYNFRFDPRQVSTSQPQLLLEVMKFTKATFYHGEGLKRKEGAMMPRFRNILDIDPGLDHEGRPRQLPEDALQILIAIKQEMLDIVERFLDMQDNSIVAEEIKGIPLTSTEDKIKLQLQQTWLQAYNEADLTTRDALDLAPVLLRLAKHAHPQLTSHALSLLKRLALRGSKQAILLKLLPKIQILTRTEDKTAHAQIEKKLLSLKALSANPLKDSDVKVVNGILGDLMAACLHHAVYQPMFLGMGAHSDVLNLIRRPLEFEGGFQEADETLIRGYRFLREFCLKNKPNQEEMFGHVEFMTNQLIQYRQSEAVSTAILRTITAVFTANGELCRRVTEPLILPFVKLFLEQHVNTLHIYMDFFQAIIKPAGFVNKKNQTTVLKLAMSMKPMRDMILAIRETVQCDEVVPVVPEIVVTSPAAQSQPAASIDSIRISVQQKKKKTEKLKAGAASAASASIPTIEIARSTKESAAPVSEGLFDLSRAAIMSLLALCTEAQNSFTERTCQRLLSLDESVSACHQIAFSSQEKNLRFRLVGSYLRFLDEVYLNTESSTSSLPSAVNLASNPRLWDLIGYFVLELQEFKKANLAFTASDQYKFNLFQVVLPFLQNFYARFSVLQANQHQKAISTALLGILHYLRKDIYKGQKEEQYITNLMKVMVETGVTSTLGITPESLPKFTQVGTSPITDSVLVVPHRSGLSAEKLFYKKLSSKVYGVLVELIVEVENPAAFAPATPRTGGGYDVLPPRGRDVSPTPRGEKKHGKATEPKAKAALHVAAGGDPLSFVELVVAQISNAKETKDDRLAITCLRLVKKMVKTSPNQASRQTLQSRLATLDTPLHLLSMLRSSNIKLTAAAMSTLRVLLSDGSAVLTPAVPIVENISHAFSQGNYRRFFEDVVAILDAAKLHLREQKRKTQHRTTKVLVQRQSEHLSAAAAVSNSKSAAEKEVDPDEGVEMEVMVQMQDAKEKIISPDEIHLGAIIPDLYTVIYLMSQGYPLFKSLSPQLVPETVGLLKVFESAINPINIDVAIQIFTAMKELARGDEENHRSALAAQILTPINRILSSWTSPPSNTLGGDFYLRTFDLKIAMVDFLHSIIENTTDEVIAEVIHSLNFPSCTKNTALLKNITALAPKQRKRAILLASSIFRLVKSLASKDASNNSELASNLKEIEANCASRIGTVEVVNNKVLAPIYFPIPTAFRPAKKTEQEFNDAVKKSETELLGKLEEHFLSTTLDLSKSSEKTEAFQDWIDSVLFRREYAFEVKDTSRAYDVFVHSWNFWWHSSFLLAICMNILMLVYAKPGYLDSTSEEFWESLLQIRIIGIIQTVFAFFMMLTILLKKGVLLNRLKWRDSGPKTVPYSLLPWPQIKSRLTNGSSAKFCSGSLKHLLTDPFTLFTAVYFVFSVLGNAVSPYFFAAHLFQIVVRSHSLKSAIKAFVKNVVTLFFLLILLINGIYIIAIISFNFFTDQYEFTMDNEFLPGTSCSGLWECMMTNMYYGMGFGLVTFLPAYADPTNEKRGWWTLFQLLAFFIFGQLMLNFILAVILDSFSSLREAASHARELLEDECLICSLDKDEFQRQNHNFLVHVNKDHNKLHYLYFFAYLKEIKRKQKLNGLSALEKAIFDKIESGQALEIFPLGRALALERDTEKK